MKLLKKTLIALGVMLTGLSVVAFTKPDSTKKTIAITQIIEHPALDATYKGIIDELAENGLIAGENYKLIHESAQGDPVNAAQIAQKFGSLGADVIVALGTTSAQALKKTTKSTQTPVVFSSITDPLGARLVNNLQKPEGNFTGQSNWIAVRPQLEKMLKIIPSLKTLGIIYNPGEANGSSMFLSIKEEAEKLGVRVIPGLATNSSEVPQAAQRLVSQADAIFISNDNTALSAFKGIVNVANKGKIPVFVSDTDMVKDGAVGALGPNQYELGRQTGKMVIKILNGEKVGNLPIEFPRKMQFVLNKKAITGIGLAISEQVLQEADIIIGKEDTLKK